MNKLTAPSKFDYCKSVKPYNLSRNDCLRKECVIYPTLANEMWGSVCHYEIWGKFSLLLKRSGLFLVLEFCVWRYADDPWATWVWTAWVYFYAVFFFLIIIFWKATRIYLQQPTPVSMGPNGSWLARRSHLLPLSTQGSSLRLLAALGTGQGCRPPFLQREWSSHEQGLYGDPSLRQGAPLCSCVSAGHGQELVVHIQANWAAIVFLQAAVAAGGPAQQLFLLSQGPLAMEHRPHQDQARHCSHHCMGLALLSCV